jgi:parallel beta-helix repeat protein
MRNSGIWKILAVSIVLVLIGSGLAIITNSAIVSANTLYGDFSVCFITDKQRYQCGEPVKMTMTISNRGPNATLVCSDNCLFCGFEVNKTVEEHEMKPYYNFGFSIVDKYLKQVYQYKSPFNASRKTEIQITHNETLEILNFTWNQVDDHENPVPYGRYRVFLTKSYCSGIICSSSSSNKYLFRIIPELPSGTIYVPDNITTIQEAVDLAMEGNTIVVKDGIYSENIFVGKPLTIKSENGADATIIQAANSNNPIFYLLNADYVNISGFTINGATESVGIYLGRSDNCNISNLNATDNQHGIYLSRSNNNTLINNTINSNNQTGISLHFSKNNTLANNTVSNSEEEGICLYSSTNNTICNNNLNYNEVSIKLESSNKNILTMNTNLNYWLGIHLKYSSNNKISLNNFIDNRFNNVLSINSANIWNSTEEITCTYNGKTYTKYLGNYWDD